MVLLSRHSWLAKGVSLKIKPSQGHMGDGCPHLSLPSRCSDKAASPQHSGSTPPGLFSELHSYSQRPPSFASSSPGSFLAVYKHDPVSPILKSPNQTKTSVTSCCFQLLSPISFHASFTQNFFKEFSSLPVSVSSPIIFLHHSWHLRLHPLYSQKLHLPGCPVTSHSQIQWSLLGPPPH